MISELKIENFKSIKKIELKPKRINLFIGRPNVGKSNILEALSLLNLPMHRSGYFLKALVRFNNIKNLFYDNITKNNIKVETDKAVLKTNTKYSEFQFLILSTTSSKLTKEEKKFLFQSESYQEFLDKLNVNKAETTLNELNHLKFYEIFFEYDGSIIRHNMSAHNTIFKKYIYTNNSTFSSSSYRDFLLPVFGENLFTVIQENNKLMNEFAAYFEEYNLNLVYDIERNSFVIQKQEGRIIYKYPFDLIADSLKRLIFYIAAIETNKNSCLIFEEPEVHSYPPYIKILGERIAKEKNNQFFITTHSPYLLSSIIENTDPSDLNICLTYYDDYQTKVKELSREEIEEIAELDADAFFNFENFLQ